MTDTDTTARHAKPGPLAAQASTDTDALAAGVALDTGAPGWRALLARQAQAADDQHAMAAALARVAILAGRLACDHVEGVPGLSRGDAAAMILAAITGPDLPPASRPGCWQAGS